MRLRVPHHSRPAATWAPRSPASTDFAEPGGPNLQDSSLSPRKFSTSQFLRGVRSMSAKRTYASPRLVFHKSARKFDAASFEIRARAGIPREPCPMTCSISSPRNLSNRPLAVAMSTSASTRSRHGITKTLRRSASACSARSLSLASATLRFAAMSSGWSADIGAHVASGYVLLSKPLKCLGFAPTGWPASPLASRGRLRKNRRKSVSRIKVRAPHFLARNEPRPMATYRNERLNPLARAASLSEYASVDGDSAGGVRASSIPSLP